MLTRTSIIAEVKATIVEKTSDGIASREVDVTIDKCASREKAEIALSKMFKKAIVDITEIQFFADKRTMSDGDFEKYSVLKEHKVLTEEEIAHINNSRKRGK